MINTDRLRLMEVYCEVVRAGSFRAAAVRLGIQAPAVSKSVARLEEELGVKLLHRSTRKMALTDQGADFFKQCERLVVEVSSLFDQTSGDTALASGEIRISATIAFGQHLLAPLLGSYQKANPLVRCNLILTDRIVDFHGEGLDIAFRSTRELEDSSLYCQRLCSPQRILVAAPDYVAHKGAPETPQQLNAHTCMAFQARKLFKKWTLMRDGRSADINIRPAFVSNNYNALLGAALQGLGIANLFDYMVSDLIADGALIRILPEFAQPHQNVYAIYAQRRSQSAALDGVLNYLSTHLGVQPRRL